jgi:geranylgeranyl pyrophosphate synthase
MLTNQLESGFVAVDQTLLDVVATDVEMLQDASHHIIASGGKRIRPRVVFLSYLAAGGTNLDEVVPLAAAIELVHTATLVHDDINDHSLTRRGKISVHARFGHTFALLTGDYLFTKVYELMAPYGPQYNRIMAGACVSLVEGETLQAAAAKAGTINQETYKVIITRKTASLFGAAARMGSSLAGGDEALASKLSEYGYNLGLAFQIVDDILDIVGDPDMMGKPVGNDLAQGAGALVAQNGKKGSGPTTMSSHDPIDEYIARLRDSGAVDVAFAQANEWAGRARKALEFLPDSPARIELYRLVDTVIERQK